MSEIYPNINSIELAKKYDIILRTIMEDYRNENYTDMNLNPTADVDGLKKQLANKGFDFEKGNLIDLLHSLNNWDLIIFPNPHSSAKVFDISPRGRFVILNGGLTNYVQQKIDEKALTKQLAASTLSANRNQLIYSFITGAIICIGIIIQTLQYVVSTTQTRVQKEQLNTSILELHKSLHDSLCPLLNHISAKKISITKSDVKKLR